MIKRKKVVKDGPTWADSPEELLKKEKNEGKGKKRQSSIKSEVDGIKFDSQLEVYCYKKLQESGLKFEYTKHTYVISEAFTCIGETYEPDKRKGNNLYTKSKKLQSIKYTPDFVGNNWIIETKGIPNENFAMRFKLFKKYLTDNNLKYDLFVLHNHKQIDEAIKIILDKNK